MVATRRRSGWITYYSTVVNFYQANFRYKQGLVCLEKYMFRRKSVSKLFGNEYQNVHL